jgi:hypothetical protein
LSRGVPDECHEDHRRVNVCPDSWSPGESGQVLSSWLSKSVQPIATSKVVYAYQKAEVLIDVFIERSEYKFGDDISAIERLKRRMIDLRDVGHIAQQADLKTALETASTGMHISSCRNNKTLTLIAMASLHEKTIFALDDLRTEVAALKDLTCELQQQNYGSSSTGLIVV